MKKIAFLVITICVLIYTKSSAQNRRLLKEVKIDSFLPVDSITDVEIYNSWDNKRYNLSPTGKAKLKNILNKSKAYNMPILKPGHFYMKIAFKNSDTLKSYEIYMYPEFIILDPPYLSKLPFYYIKLSKSVNWDKLND
ncbi:hypothetical protein ACFQZS_18405 [Mucilaginibacter calamicampi]|uniref:Uncharacterized protein n=1 Tax=Mucilaginibacter calamicampi TaxID=1302352 RepID=A0ABW2Z3P3_9SPHI